MEQKHSNFKNYRTIIRRGDEIQKEKLNPNGIYAVAYKVEADADSHWGIICMECGRIRHSYNVTVINGWSFHKQDDEITIDLHYFACTEMEHYFALQTKDYERLDKVCQAYKDLYNESEMQLDDIQGSLLHQLAEKLRKFFSV